MALGFIVGWFARGAAEDVADAVGDVVDDAVDAVDKAGRAVAAKLSPLTNSCPKTLGAHNWKPVGDDEYPTHKRCSECDKTEEVNYLSKRAIRAISSDPAEYAQREDETVWQKLFG